MLLSSLRVNLPSDCGSEFLELAQSLGLNPTAIQSRNSEPDIPSPVVEYDVLLSQDSSSNTHIAQALSTIVMVRIGLERSPRLRSALSDVGMTWMITASVPDDNHFTRKIWLQKTTLGVCSACNVDIEIEACPGSAE